MRIITWNCRMAFAKKRELLYKLRPDIAVIPECSQDSMLECQKDGFGSCWWGENKHKGLGLIAARPWTLEPGSTPRQKWIAPARVSGPIDFLLLSVWACPVGRERERNYIGQVYEAIVRHPEWFAGHSPVVLCGDFNSNANFDRHRKKRTHSAVVKLLAERDIVSAYHTFFSEDPGEEARPTYYFWHKKERPFHLDYIFVPRAWSCGMRRFRVGTYKKWMRSSDHVPIVADIDDPSGPTTQHKSTPR